MAKEYSSSVFSPKYVVFFIHGQTSFSSLVRALADDPWHKAVGGRVAAQGFRALGQAVAIRAKQGW